MLSHRDRDTRIEDIEPINHPTHVKLKEPDMFQRFIEAPLREAVRTLIERGVTTIASSANQLDIGELGYLSIDFDGLSAENQNIATELVNEGDARLSKRLGPIVLIIEFSISEHSTVGSVNDWIVSRALRFQPQ